MPQSHAIWATLGPATLQPEFLRSVQGRVSLLRLNLSHMTLPEMCSAIDLIRAHTDTEICIDTQGAQMRTRAEQDRSYQVGDAVVITPGEIEPRSAWTQLHPGDRLRVGFAGLVVDIIDRDADRITARCVDAGTWQSHKGIHCVNHPVELPDLTEQDLDCIQSARDRSIHTFALSFTRNHQSIRAFQSLLPSARLIYKIETASALQDLDRMFQTGTEFLIDRGDLGQEIGADHTPVAQRQIFRTSQQYPDVKILVATNFLESMIDRPYATRAELNDIYTALEQGAAGLILAGETAIGKYPTECVSQIERMIQIYSDQQKAQ
jgi:pyruvate kinase